MFFFIFSSFIYYFDNDLHNILVSSILCQVLHKLEKKN